MVTYTYDATTGEYLGVLNPDGVPTDTIGTTDLQPPDFTDTHIGVWTGTEWDLRVRPSVIAAAKAAAIAAVQARLDALAQSWGYDDIKSGADYRDDPYPRFGAEGRVMFLWRSATWAAVDQHQDATSWEELLSYLPAIPSRPS